VKGERFLPGRHRSAESGGVAFRVAARVGVDACSRCSPRHSNRRDALGPGYVQPVGARKSLGRATPNGSRVRTHVLVRFATDRLLNRGQTRGMRLPSDLGARPRNAAFHLSRFRHHASHQKLLADLLERYSALDSGLLI